MIACVLGMHKSGTTLVAEMLHHSGIHMADVPDDLSYDQSNKYERHEPQRMNRAMLAPILVPTIAGWRRRNTGLDRAGYEVNLDSLAWVRRRRLAAVDAGRVPPGTVNERDLEDLIEQLSGEHEHWGFKDPRTCLTYSVWRRHLPPHRLIAVYRPLHEVLRRYRVSNKTPGKAVRVTRNWIIHNEMILRHLSRTDDFIVVRYDSMMTDVDQLARLEDYVGRPLRDRRDPALYRARSSDDPEQRFSIWLPSAVHRTVESLDAAFVALAKR